jgi:endonuclease III
VVQPKRETRAPWASSETSEDKRKRGSLILRRLRREYPEPKTALNYRNPFELLISTILSAQSTDKKINEITPALFERFPTPEAVIAAKPGEIEDLIRQSGFFNQKARNIRGACQVLVDEFDGQVPGRMEDLLKLPGVARKTANVVLGDAFGVRSGIAVDTHVHRLSWRLALSDGKDPVRVEQDLMDLFPKPRWTSVSHLLILHGRAVCDAKKPRCGDCVVADRCPSAREV